MGSRDTDARARLEELEPRLLLNGQADLIMGAMVIGTMTVDPGFMWNQTFRAINDGTAAPATTFTVGGYISADTTFTVADDEIGTFAVNGLGVGANASQSMLVTAPTTPGTGTSRFWRITCGMRVTRSSTSALTVISPWTTPITRAPWPRPSLEVKPNAGSWSAEVRSACAW